MGQHALKAPPTPRTRGAIPTTRNTPVLQHSAPQDSRTRTRTKRLTSTSAERRTPNAKRLVRCAPFAYTSPGVVKRRRLTEYSPPSPPPLAFQPNPHPNQQTYYILPSP